MRDMFKIKGLKEKLIYFLTISLVLTPASREIIGLDLDVDIGAKPVLGVDAIQLAG
jgi:hypothetical protein